MAVIIGTVAGVGVVYLRSAANDLGKVTVSAVEGVTSARPEPERHRPQPHRIFPRPRPVRTRDRSAPEATGRRPQAVHRSGWRCCAATAGETRNKLLDEVEESYTDYNAGLEAHLATGQAGGCQRAVGAGAAIFARCGDGKAGPRPTRCRRPCVPIPISSTSRATEISQPGRGRCGLRPNFDDRRFGGRCRRRPCLRLSAGDASASASP